MPEQPLVSIIIPTFNRAHLLGETLDSVLAQTYTNWECIVVDDGATDGTAALLANYIDKDSRFQYYKRPDTHLPGGNGARNYGFERSNGEFVQWFDDDDVMLPTFLNVKVQAFTKKVEMVICSGCYVDNNLKNSKNINLKLKTFLFKDYVLWQAQILTPSVLFRRTYLVDKLLFSNKIYRGQETEFFSRLFFKLSIENYVILNEFLFLYRQHDSTKTSLNTSYVSKFKYSQSVIFLGNLNRAIEIKDKDLINYCFQTLLLHFYSSIKFQDYITTRYIYKELLPILKRNNFILFLEFWIIGGLMLFFKKSSYRVYKRWGNMLLY